MVHQHFPRNRARDIYNSGALDTDDSGRTYDAVCRE